MIKNKNIVYIIFLTVSFCVLIYSLINIAPAIELLFFSGSEKAYSGNPPYRIDRIYEWIDDIGDLVGKRKLQIKSLKLLPLHLALLLISFTVILNYSFKLISIIKKNKPK